MIFPALMEAADRGELILVDGGMCRYHCRRDGVVTIREVIVLPCKRGKGIGRKLCNMVRARVGPCVKIVARCPASYESNGFWERIGFVKVESGEVNVWESRP